MKDNPWIEMKGALYGKEKAKVLLKGRSNGFTISRWAIHN